METSKSWLAKSRLISEKEAMKVLRTHDALFKKAEKSKSVDGVIDLECYCSKETRIIEGNLTLPSLHLESGGPSLFVAGNLDVKGLLKHDSRAGFLVVLGNLSADAIVTTSQIVIVGSLDVRDTIYGNCTNYTTAVLGRTKAKLLVSAKEHYFCFYGGKDIETIVDVYGDTPNLDDRDFDSEEALAMSDPYSDDEAAKLLAEGRSLLAG